MPIITDRDIADIKGALAELAPYIEEPAIYRRYLGLTEGNPVLGIPAQPNYESVAIALQARELTLEDVMVSGGAYVMGDVEFTIRKDQAPGQLWDQNLTGAIGEDSLLPDHPDRIVWNSAAYRPKSIKHLWLGGVLWWEIRAGRT